MIEELFVYILLIIFAGVLSLILCLFSFLKLKNALGAGHALYAAKDNGRNNVQLYKGSS